MRPAWNADYLVTLRAEDLERVLRVLPQLEQILATRPSEDRTGFSFLAEGEEEEEVTDGPR